MQKSFQYCQSSWVCFKHQHLPVLKVQDSITVRATTWGSHWWYPSSLSTLGASLIAGLEYGMERWNGKRNGTMNVHSCSLLV